ncbi:Defb15 [Phodopus roborovskii]|uniref:Beta-defensin n=1 Tax=Phodopus roborovskii TaxID=109678 RepID=A0AAU9Z571_PHORO|nr:Defb15 [Phodopus roborovskii]
MKAFFFLFALLFFLSPAKNAFFDEKCSKLNGRCTNYCQKNEELTALCQKTLKCCVIVQPCGIRTNDSAEDLGT